MANIAIFVGRKHHAQKLMNIGRFLAFRGHTVFPITANNAINIDPPQEDIGGYVHVYHYLTDADVKEIDDYVVKKEIQSNVPQFWKEYSLREQLLSFYAFRNYLQSDDKPDAVLILHENNFWTKPLSFLCERLGIPCFAFQEGLLRRKDQDDMMKQSFACEYSAKLFVWGEDSKRQYIEAGIPEQKIIVSGAAHLVSNKQRVENDRKRIVYFLPLMQHYVGNPQRDIELLASYCRENDFDFVVRPHPFDNSIELPFIMDKREDVVDVILEADVALVQHSTTALECLALGTPVIEAAFGKKDFIEPLHKEQPLIPVIRANPIEFDVIRNVLSDSYVDQIGKWVDDKILIGNLDLITSEIEAYLD